MTSFCARRSPGPKDLARDDSSIAVDTPTRTQRKSSLFTRRSAREPRLRRSSREKHEDAFEMWMSIKKKHDKERSYFTVPPAMQLMNNWRVEMYYRRKKKAGTVTLRDHAYRFFANPVSSVRATKFAALIWLLSFASILTFGIENTEHSEVMLGLFVGHDLADAQAALQEHLAAPPRLHLSWFRWNCFLTGVFGLELLARVLTYRKCAAASPAMRPCPSPRAFPDGRARRAAGRGSIISYGSIWPRCCRSS